MQLLTFLSNQEVFLKPSGDLDEFEIIRLSSEQRQLGDEEHSHCQHFDVHNLLPELPARGGVVLKRAVIVSQIPEEINRVTVCQNLCTEMQFRRLYLPQNVLD